MSYLWNLLLYRPLLNALAFLVSVIPGGDVGIAVIILTIITKIIFFPFSQRAIENQAAINILAPELDKIKKSGVSKEEVAKLTFALYKKHKVNPFSGCLLQLPGLIVIFALYRVFIDGTALNNELLYSFIDAPEHINTLFLGLIDISKQSFILAAVAGLTQYFQAYFMPAPSAKASSATPSFQESFGKSMMMQAKYILPIFIFIILYTDFLGIFLSGAVALYIITNNLFTIGQQIYVNKTEKKVLDEEVEILISKSNMDKGYIQNLIKELIEKTGVATAQIAITEDAGGSTWFSVEVSEPHFFVTRDGEALYALNHLVRRIVEAKATTENNLPNVLIDINGFQKKRVENIRAVAHMMGERARYFKSNIEVDPMSAFERRIVHEFLSNATDLKTESVGFGPSRRVVIRYIGAI